MNVQARNFKRICIAPEYMLVLFLEPKWDVLYRLHFDGVPLDAEILDVHYAPENREFGFLVSHPSFPVVPDGEMIPREPGQIMVYRKVEGHEVVPDAVVG